MMRTSSFVAQFTRDDFNASRVMINARVRHINAMLRDARVATRIKMRDTSRTNDRVDVYFTTTAWKFGLTRAEQAIVDAHVMTARALFA